VDIQTSGNTSDDKRLQATNTTLGKQSACYERAMIAVTIYNRLQLGFMAPFKL
jgi:hypothetical protein